MTGAWREGQAAQYDFYVGELDTLLAELENAEAICLALDQAGLLTETRSFIGGVRSLRNDLTNKARELRRHADVDQLPISLTTRNVRPG
jgi:hypothetical protein